MNCPYCDKEMNLRSKEIKDFHSYIEGLNYSSVDWHECSECNSQCINNNWFAGKNVIIATENQIKYIKRLFIKLNIYDNKISKWRKCNKVIYMCDNKAIKITKEKANNIITYLNKIENYDDWNKRIESYINKNIKSEYLKMFLPSKLDLFINMIENNIFI